MQTSSRVTDDSNRRNSQPAEHKPKLLDQVRQAVRARHYSNLETASERPARECRQSSASSAVEPAR
jgi:hypothetical protein